MKHWMLASALTIQLLGCGQSDEHAMAHATSTAYKGGYDDGYAAAQKDNAAYKKGYADAVECLGQADTFKQKSACVAKGL